MQDEFRVKVESIDKERVNAFLNALTKPCYESELLRIAFPGCRMLDMDALSLYQHHFLLFHLLYKLQDEYLKKDQYLHVHFMRIFLTDYPKEGDCRYYDEELGTFCKSPCDIKNNYCDVHFSLVGGMQLEELSARYFYLDPDNYDQFDAASAESFMNGAWEILMHHKEFKESYKILDLPLTANRQMIKNKFRMLAKQYHPDLGAASHEKFNKINRAYQFLARVVP